MASIRQLPSGNYQAAVLLAGGTRTTQTFPDENTALAWAIEMETERDRLRDQARNRSVNVHVTALLAELAHLADKGQLTVEHRDRLRAITRSIRAAS
ncbi:hypothetical protein [Phytohabitans suffuscus]|uniref:Uncharacterized protein n=1 Tax=Phytohabitans suffuscus TaxID=624315 RepID=A0A6F8YAS0_9ACTN|nr:hypothetical protein [Phytohabitans suffuscus]BCB83129.1 hypothetical protein Psuf_004420 [Phytohabitans suffuscus]